MPLDPRAFAERLYRLAVGACQPAPLVAHAFESFDWRPRPPGAPDLAWIIATGKAADGMAAAAADHLRERGIPLAGGLVVAADAAPSAPLPGVLDRLTGDHPLPGDASRRAAIAVEQLAARIGAPDRVLALISGGTSSLIGAPVEGIADGHYWTLCAALLDSGLDITALNAVRKRFSRWGAGRLGLALAPSVVATLAISDVPHDDPAVIGSGPTVGDPVNHAEVRSILRGLALPNDVRRALDAWLADVAGGGRGETPEPGDSRLAHVLPPIVITAQLLARAALDAARASGIVRIHARGDRVSDDADRAGAMLAAELVGFARSLAPGETGVLVAWGEPVVSLPPGAPPGGRCQELALMAARVLAESGSDASRCVLLAAGSDGRDGPTDAAGAVVDASTWRRLVDGGEDPDRALAGHGASSALAAAGAIIPRFASGTNLGDLIIGIAGA